MLVINKENKKDIYVYNKILFGIIKTNSEIFIDLFDCPNQLHNKNS